MSIKNLTGLIDARDVLGAVGLGLLAYGLWLVWPPAAAIVPGAVMTGVAVFGTR